MCITLFARNTGGQSLENFICLAELQSLEQSLMRKEQTAREQAREMQRPEAHNADLESQVQRLMSAHTEPQLMGVI